LVRRAEQDCDEQAKIADGLFCQIHTWHVVFPFS
jgi:hypothetical protein